MRAGATAAQNRSVNQGCFIMQIFFNKVSALDVDPHTTVSEVKSQIEVSPYLRSATEDL